MTDINNSRKILCTSNFEPTISGHGGNRRSAQLYELLNSANIEISRPQIENPHKFSKVNRYFHGIRLALTNPIIVNTKKIKELGYTGWLYLNINSQIEEEINSSIVLWEATQNLMIPLVSKSKNYKVVACPQNIEALAPILDEKINFDQKLNLTLDKLNKELYFLEKSDIVFCISREEQWLLKLFGINAYFLPYYPVKSIFNELINIRQKRNYSHKSKLLILGTVYNPPTLNGMIDLINLLKRSDKFHNLNLNIVGYGTERLVNFFDDDNLNIVGSVSVEELNNILTETRAVLVHQKSGVGALTKIPEMLIAGIPIIVNDIACRSAFHYDGVNCYDTPEKLFTLMEKNLSIPAILPRPVEQETFFVNAILDLFKD